MQVTLDCTLFTKEGDAEDFLRHILQEQLPEASLVSCDEKGDEFSVGLHVGSIAIRANKPEPKK